MINYGYFRHRFDAHENRKINKLIDEIGLVGYAYYYTLVELYGAKISNQEDKTKVEIHIRIIANTWRKRVDSVHLVLTKLQLSDLLVYTSCDSICTLSIPNFLKYYGSYSKTDAQRSRNKRKEKKRKEKEIKKPKKQTFDFTSIGQNWFRKAAYKTGVKNLSVEIKNIEQYNSFLKAAENYEQSQIDADEDFKYAMGFNKFAECWEQWVNVSTFSKTQLEIEARLNADIAEELAKVEKLEK